MTRPDICTNEMLEYLDKLRKSGITNMILAGTYIKDDFELTRKEANTILTYWMKTFGKETR